jgi:hypothetical protein
MRYEFVCQVGTNLTLWGVTFKGSKNNARVSLFPLTIKSHHLHHFWSGHIISGCSHSRFSTEFHFHHLHFHTFTDRRCYNWFRFTFVTLMFKFRINTSIIVEYDVSDSNAVMISSICYTLGEPTLKKPSLFAGLVYDVIIHVIHAK